MGKRREKRKGIKLWAKAWENVVSDFEGRVKKGDKNIKIFITGHVEGTLYQFAKKVVEVTLGEFAAEQQFVLKHCTGIPIKKVDGFIKRYQILGTTDKDYNPLTNFGYGFSFSKEDIYFSQLEVEKEVEDAAWKKDEEKLGRERLNGE